MYAPPNNSLNPTPQQHLFCEAVIDVKTLFSFLISERADFNSFSEFSSAFCPRSFIW
jgi:hypothetical protein